MFGRTVRNIGSSVAVLLVATFMLTSPASASTSTYDLTADWDEPPCTVKINDRTGVITPYYVMQGTDISISLKNQSATDLSVVFAPADGQAVTKVLAAGENDSEAYPDFQGSISVTPSPVSTTCSGDETEPGPASISIVAKAAASVAPPTVADDTAPQAAAAATKATTPSTTKNSTNKTPSKQTFGIQKGPQLSKTIVSTNASAKALNGTTLGVLSLVIFLLLAGAAFFVLRRRASKRMPIASTGAATLHPKYKR
jgi:hypothetical protein